jgi:tripartite-type tricarboxylate transporter receptor subunit TctC
LNGEVADTTSSKGERKTSNDSKGNLDAGKLRPLAVMSEKRTQLFPGVPAMSELGLKGMDLGVWFGVFAPAKTPPAVIDRLSRVIKKIMA